MLVLPTMSRYARLPDAMMLAAMVAAQDGSNMVAPAAAAAVGIGGGGATTTAAASGSSSDGGGGGAGGGAGASTALTAAAAAAVHDDVANPEDSMHELSTSLSLASETVGSIVADLKRAGLGTEAQELLTTASIARDVLDQVRHGCMFGCAQHCTWPASHADHHHTPQLDEQLQENKIAPALGATLRAKVDATRAVASHLQAALREWLSAHVLNTRLQDPRARKKVQHNTHNASASSHMMLPTDCMSCFAVCAGGSNEH